MRFPHNFLTIFVSFTTVATALPIRHSITSTTDLDTRNTLYRRNGPLIVEVPQPMSPTDKEELQAKILTHRNRLPSNHDAKSAKSALVTKGWHGDGGDMLHANFQYYSGDPGRSDPLAKPYQVHKPLDGMSSRGWRKRRRMGGDVAQFKRLKNDGPAGSSSQAPQGGKEKSVAPQVPSHPANAQANSPHVGRRVPKITDDPPYTHALTDPAKLPVNIPKVFPQEARLALENRVREHYAAIPDHDPGRLAVYAQTVHDFPDENTPDEKNNAAVGYYRGGLSRKKGRIAGLYYVYKNDPVYRPAPPDIDRRQ